MRKLLVGAFVALGLLAVAASQTIAATRDTGALITLTAQGAGTVNSTTQTNVDGRGLICTWWQASHTGTPSSTFAIQFNDTASGQWVTLLTSAAQTADTTAATLSVFPAATVTANVSANVTLPRTWRVTTTVGGTTPGVTGTIGCSVLN